MRSLSQYAFMVCLVAAFFSDEFGVAAQNCKLSGGSCDITTNCCAPTTCMLPTGSQTGGVCRASGPASVPAGGCKLRNGSCSTTTDCCSGLTCSIPSGATGGTCV